MAAQKEISFTSDGLTLKGTLRRPPASKFGEVLHPAILFCDGKHKYFIQSIIAVRSNFSFFFFHVGLRTARQNEPVSKFASFFQRKGFITFTFDFRGFGDSEGLQWNLQLAILWFW